MIEKVIKTCKAHRSMADIDCSYIQTVVQGMVDSELLEDHSAKGAAADRDGIINGAVDRDDEMSGSAI